jgi:hypothetical protein
MVRRPRPSQPPKRSSWRAVANISQARGRARPRTEHDRPAGLEELEGIEPGAKAGTARCDKCRTRAAAWATVLPSIVRSVIRRSGGSRNGVGADARLRPRANR